MLDAMTAHPAPNGLQQPSALEEAVLQRIAELVSLQTGVRPRQDGGDELRTILRERQKLLKLPTLDEYRRFLDSGSNGRQEQERLAIQLTTGETYFFRDQGQFSLLREEILPELIERRQAGHSLRIWSAGCSSGEEAYSLAMLLDELMPRMADWKLLILGTDINPEAIAKARRGIYGRWSFRAVSPELKRKYFRRLNDAWQLDERIRRMVTFDARNLLADEVQNAASDLHDMDLILCRNVFIYLAPSMAARVADKLAEMLAKDGFLITGHGELYGHKLGKLRTRIFPESIVYQKTPVSEAPSFPVPPAEPRSPAIARPAPLSSPVPKMQMVSPAPAAPRSSPPSPEAFSAMNEAWECANRGQLEKAAEYCNAMIAKDPLLAEPYYLSALLAEERESVEEARILLKQAIYLDHLLIAAYLELGDLYERDQQGALAEKMRATASNLLKKLPIDATVRFCGATTAGEMLAYLEGSSEISQELA